MGTKDGHECKCSHSRRNHNKDGVCLHCECEAFTRRQAWEKTISDIRPSHWTTHYRKGRRSSDD